MSQFNITTITKDVHDPARAGVGGHDINHTIRFAATGKGGRAYRGTLYVRNNGNVSSASHLQSMVSRNGRIVWREMIPGPTQSALETYVLSYIARLERSGEKVQTSAERDAALTTAYDADRAAFAALCEQLKVKEVGAELTRLSDLRDTSAAELRRCEQALGALAARFAGRLVLGRVPEELQAEAERVEYMRRAYDMKVIEAASYRQTTVAPVIAALKAELPNHGPEFAHMVKSATMYTLSA